MFKTFGVALAAATLIGCGSPAPESAEATEALRPVNCALVLCYQPQCEPGQVLRTPKGQCCPQCVNVRTPKLQPGDCACSGGAMDASSCDQFGAPWSWRNGVCSWDARAQGGLTAEECAAVQAKHQGDGSGSDIYNLGLSCEYGVSDCNTRGCPTGQECIPCKTTDGTGANVCMPAGSTC